ncbi:MAG: citrate/2-methylcitrate synthase, partial [Deltaproteobacteria bacterium]
MTAAEAAKYLGIKRTSLYAYASRGLVASRSQPGERARQYARSDLDRLKARHDARSGHGPVAGGALRWGEPVLETSVGEITPRGPSYRGELAVTLAERGVPFESVAELLWTGTLPGSRPTFRAESLGWPDGKLAALVTGDAPLVATLALCVNVFALGDPARFVTDGPTVLARARTTIARLAAACALPFDRARVQRSLEAPRVAQSLGRALGAKRGADGVDAIDAALVLCADHELNVSTFAARVAASAGADVYACLLAALATLSGPDHGGMCDRVEALVAETGKARRAGDVVAARARRGDGVPGFGHPLYPSGDPRASALMARARSLAGTSSRAAVVFALADAGRDAGYGEPVLDFGLVALAAALDDFFNAFGSLAASPTDVGERQTLMQRAAILTDRFQLADQRLDQVQADLDSQINTDVASTNR